MCRNPVSNTYTSSRGTAANVTVPFSSGCDASRVLTAKDDKTLYFTYQLTVGQGGMVWADLDAFKADLNTLAQTVQFPGLPE